MYGYELLHRRDAAEEFDGSDPDRATVELLDGSVFVNQFEDLTCGKLGFVNVPRNLLEQDFLRILPADRTVIEVLETVRPEPAVVVALERLKAAGYRIALDDFVDEPDYAPLIALADIIKIDWLATQKEQRREYIERYSNGERLMLAEKVETREQYEEAVELGYDLFQGYFFCRPEISSLRRLPGSKANYVRFLREISREDLSLEQLGDIIKSELSLSARLLRYLNSGRFGIERPIDSIQEALAHLGDRETRRFGTLVALAGLGDDKPLELIRTCLVRARFCEQAAVKSGNSGAAMDLYLTGLFSAIDALIDRPLDEALDKLGLPAPVQAAIRGEESDLSKAFGLVVACERGDITAFRRHSSDLGLRPEVVSGLYAEALFWADRIFSLGGRGPEDLNTVP